MRLRASGIGDEKGAAVLVSATDVILYQAHNSNHAAQRKLRALATGRGWNMNAIGARQILPLLSLVFLVAALPAAAAESQQPSTKERLLQCG